MYSPSSKQHPFDPVYNLHSRVLILGTFPSVRSRENGFYYGHPQNRFWRVLSSLVGEPVPTGNEARRAMVLRHGIALWDTIQSCDISGSSDASIRNVIPNDLSWLIGETAIRQIFCNGRRSLDLYNRHCLQQTGVEALLLPSTSAANAAWSLDRLTEAWRMILQTQQSSNELRMLPPFPIDNRTGPC